MRNLKKNQRTIWYAAYLGEREVEVDGRKSGQTSRYYADPVAVDISLRTCTGQTDIDVFGVEFRYDRVMTSASRLPINELSKLWVDRTPEDGPADYIVKRAAFGLDQNVWGLSKVTGDE